MSDAAVQDLARRAGIALEWLDYKGQPHSVSLETLRAILGALGVPCATSAQAAESRRASIPHRPRPLITATAAEAQPLPMIPENDARTARIHYEDGTVEDLPVESRAGIVHLPPISAAGYHDLEIGTQRHTLAVAPPRCHTIADAAGGERIWGLAAQIYGLKSPGDCGIGDMAGVAALARSAASLDADALALSPIHALFTADASHFSPYSPSSRLFYNPLHAEAGTLFGDERVANALAKSAPETLVAALHARAEIDWPQAARIKLAAHRRLFEDFCSTDLAASTPTALAADFAAFRSARGSLLTDHACFEALHAARLAADPAVWSWIDWPAQWRSPRSPAVEEFARQSTHELLFHCFLQWIADRSLAAAQRAARQEGMRVGLIADLAVGMSGAGSNAWTCQGDVLVGLDIGAPPDEFNARGQNWKLTTFSPHALTAGGFAAFIATLRTCMRHAGGVRIDHAMSLTRLWVIPRGAKADEGAYLSFPMIDQLRLIALESHRHRAIVIGEDLGTVPAGFRNHLTAWGIAGMRVLWFERERDGFRPPAAWPPDVAAMTSTHDLPTVSGWWRGHDITVRAQCGLVADETVERAARARDRRALWRAFQNAGVDRGPMPSLDAAPRIADAAVEFIAETPATLALVPLEDSLSLDDQPNLPGTIDEHPNWRRRYAAESDSLLSDREVRSRLKPLAQRRRR